MFALLKYGTVWDVSEKKIIHTVICWYQIIFWQYDTIEKILEREEKLNDLVEKSEGLSMQSKAFYKTVSSRRTQFYITIESMYSV